MNASKMYEVLVFVTHTNFILVRNFHGKQIELCIGINLLQGTLGWPDREDEVTGSGGLTHINI